VTDFVDIPGASGARYRFRRATFEDLPVNAGNVLAMTGGKARPRAVLCATARSLARARPALGEALSGRSATLYVRLNMARAVRDAEHADIVAAMEPEVVLADLG